MDACTTRRPSTIPTPATSDPASIRYSRAVGCWSTARSTTGSSPRRTPAPTSWSSTSRTRWPRRTRSRARENVIRWLAAGNRDWVRVNGFGTPWWADDLEMLAGTSVGGVMLAMVESVDHVTETAKRLPTCRSSRWWKRRADWSGSPRSPRPRARSGWRSVSATSAATPASATTRPPWPTRGHGSPSPPRPLICRAPSTARPWGPAR